MQSDSFFFLRGPRNALGILLIDFYYLPLVVTAALFAGTLAFLVSWSSAEKERQKAKRDAIEQAVKGIILIIDARIA